MEKAFRKPYFHAADMWTKIHEGIGRRGKPRVECFEEARKMILDYVTETDDEIQEKDMGLERYRKKLAEERARIAALETRVSQLEPLVTEVAELTEQLDISNNALAVSQRAKARAVGRLSTYREMVDKIIDGDIEKHLRKKNAELESRLADTEEWLDTEYGISLPKENESLATLQNARQH